MPSVVYVPFDDAQLLFQGYKIAQSHGLAAAKGPYDKTPFAELDGTLIIVAHSAPGAASLYAKATGDAASITAQALAAELVRKGLNHRCTTIEVFACNAGSAGGFVQALSGALNTKHKLRIAVDGFATTVGSVNRTGQQQVVVNVQGKGRKARIIPGSSSSSH
jgi:hypothetical protein